MAAGGEFIAELGNLGAKPVSLIVLFRELVGQRGDASPFGVQLALGAIESDGGFASSGGLGFKLLNEIAIAGTLRPKGGELGGRGSCFRDETVPFVLERDFTFRRATGTELGDLRI